MTSLQSAASLAMSKNDFGPAVEARKVGLALIRGADIKGHEKKALEELMDDLLNEGAFTTGQILRRIKAAIDLTQAHAFEFADIRRSVETVFHHQ
jgi:hypothetical protein